MTRNRPLLAVLAGAGVLGLIGTGITLAVALSGDRPDLVAHAPAAEPQVTLLEADPNSLPSEADTADAIAWAARADGRHLPSHLQYLADGQSPEVPTSQVFVAPDSVAPNPTVAPDGAVVTYTIRVSNVSEFPSDATPKDSPLARAMAQAQSRSACRGVATGITLAPADAPPADADRPSLLWLQCPDGSLERFELGPDYRLGAMTPWRFDADRGFEPATP